MKTQRFFAIIMLAIVFSLVVMPIVSPTEVYASTKKTDVGDVNISIGADGKLNIENLGKSDASQAWGDLFTQYRGFIVGLSGVGAITMIALFIIQFIKLGASAGNPQARSQALAGVLWTGLAATGLGGVTIFVGFFYNAL